MGEKEKPTVPTLDDFRSCGWEKAIAKVEKPCCGFFSTALDRLLSECGDKLSAGQRRAVQLLAAAFSMYMAPRKPNEPFGPFMEFEGRRTMVPSDYTAEEIALFAQYSNEVENPWARARLADIAWLRQSPRDTNLALLAVDAYRNIPLTAEAWQREGRDCWARALVLAKLLHRKGRERVKEMRSSLLATFQSSHCEEGWFPIGIAQLLRERELYAPSPSDVISKLEDLAREHSEKKDYFGVGDCLEEALAWVRGVDNGAKFVELTIAMAENLVSKAEFSLVHNPSGHMVAQSFYDQAIQEYRKIPKQARAAFGVDERIAVLMSRAAETGRHSLDEMGTIESDAIDITEDIEAVKKHMSGLELPKALSRLANIYRGADVAELKDEASAIMDSTPLLSIIGGVTVASDGRVVHKKTPLDPRDRNSETYEEVLHDKMVKNFQMHVGFMVASRIRPALEVLALEHRFREGECLIIAGNSPILPQDRKGLVAKGLYAGFEGDFVTALHILMPQLEHLVRTQLQAAGAITRLTDNNGIESERSLGSLLDLPEARTVLSEDLTFEMKALFCHPLGANLRNDGLHGNLGDGDFAHPCVIYAWWLMFRLIFNPFYHVLKMLKRKEGEEMESQN